MKKLYDYTERCLECHAVRAWTVTRSELGAVEHWLTRWCACPSWKLVTLVPFQGFNREDDGD